MLIALLGSNSQRSRVGRQTCSTTQPKVKTLGPTHSDPGYARTRAFYLAVGFRPLEEFGLIWDEGNPCLIMVKRL
jgi:hypothetical protein